MKKRDDAFNARDFAAVDEVHHPDVIADATGRAEPIYAFFDLALQRRQLGLA